MLYIIRGLQGSGKSTLARDLRRQNKVDAILEIDDFWIDVYGTYKYIHEQREESHIWLRRRVDVFLRSGLNVAVPEVFERKAEVDSYTIFAKMYDIKYTIIMARTPWHDNPTLLLERNVHGVPVERLLQLRNEWEDHPEEELWDLNEHCYS